MALIPRIERELAAAGEQGHIGPLWIGPNWIVALSPGLDIFPVVDIIGIREADVVAWEARGRRHPER
jgi:hypothetical protein